MGQSASSPTEDEDHLATTTEADDDIDVDIFQLTDKELTALWGKCPLTAQDIQQKARAQQQKKNKESSSSSSGFYYSEHNDNDQQDSNNNQRTSATDETDLALRLNKNITALSHLRFKLVPSRLKEDAFWFATFTCLQERLVDEESSKKQQKKSQQQVQQQQQQQPYYNNYNYCGVEADEDENIIVSEERGNDTATKDTEATTTTAHLLHELHVKNDEIASLKQQIKELKAAVAMKNNTNNNSPQPPPPPPNNNEQGQPHLQQHQNPSHHGSWVIDKDSYEFLNYPDEIKETLRAEKLRRLKQVQEEMKFILDSDDVHHTQGEWECCGETNYHAQCSM